jgi:hypothetical protein
MDSYTSEFTWELLFYLPYVFHRSSTGEEFKTKGAKDTKCFYFFKNQHEENLDRIQNDNQLNKICNIQNVSFSSKYDFFLNPKFFTFPDFKTYYSSFNEIGFDKPIIIINNKSNSEWGLKEIQNRIELNEISFIVDNFSDRYQILYFRPIPNVDISDDTPVIEWDEKSILKKKYGNKVILDNDLLQKFPHLSYNKLQLIAYSKSNKNISIGGGNAIISSLFGNENIIITKCEIGKSRKIWHTDSFLKKISNSKIYGCHDLNDLIKITRGW